MEYSFVLETPAFSINRMTYRDARFKTKEARAWEAKVSEMLQEHKMLVDMAAMAKKDGSTFGIEITVEYPPHIYWNKSGGISSKTFDVTNTEKQIVDMIFRFMETNDKYLVKLVSRKCAGPRGCIKIKLELNPQN